ncbi:MAG: ATP-binding protein [Sulfolobales archaeon]
MKRVILRFAENLEIEFTDRDQGIKHIRKLAERGTRFPLVVYGPEGCGKTALFRQAASMLSEYGYHVIYLNPLEELHRAFWVSPSLKDVLHEVIESLPKPLPNIARLALTLASVVMERFRGAKIALLLDDVFQAIGLDQAELYVKSLLNIIEYPLTPYERMVILVSSSEGVTREKIGRHRWADIAIMWNMSREGLRELYEKLPGEKPDFEDVWRWTGGNPWMLAKLYEARWHVNAAVNDIIRYRELRLFIKSLGEGRRKILEEIVQDPDTLFEKLSQPEVRELERKLIELNLISHVWDRDPTSWIDVPPPEKDSELGIGRRVAWQTPLHREAVRKALEEFNEQSLG